ncbi:MAG: hypothetical protein LBS03_03440 [Bacteroidales bacterium]|jgi:hypothetical protein|nr:hypothetical protein [Bacteroidales bacterium]
MEFIPNASKYNLPIAGAIKIPLGRYWALALLTFMSAILTLQPVLPVSSSDMYPDFRIVINCYLNYAAKLEGISWKVGTGRSANPCQISANPCHLVKDWETGEILYIPLHWILKIQPYIRLAG